MNFPLGINKVIRICIFGITNLPFEMLPIIICHHNFYKFEDRNKNISVKCIILRLCIVQSLNVFAVVDVKKLNFEFM